MSLTVQPQTRLSLIEQQQKFNRSPFASLLVGVLSVSNFLAHLIALHTGTPVALSQATLTLMFVVLGILLMGIGFGFLAKSKESLLQHRWAITMAIIMG